MLCPATEETGVVIERGPSSVIVLALGARIVDLKPDLDRVADVDGRKGRNQRRNPLSSAHQL